MAKAKEHLNVVFIGHVDHGKSTTVGRLMFDGGAIDEQTMRKLKDEAALNGKAGFEFAYVMDNLKEERERGVTIDLAHKRFNTDKYDLTIIDAPGHRDFVKNMITGASQADAGVLVVAANDGVNSQTKEHIFLAKTFGVNQLIVAVNKMDLQDWSQKRFDEVKNEVSPLLKQMGYVMDKIKFIPMASYYGENVVNKSTKTPWYSGPTLLEAINGLEQINRPTNMPLRLPIQDVYNITGIGAVPVGKVQTGKMTIGDKIIAVPGREGKGVHGELKTIEMHHTQVQEAEPGDNIGFSVRGFGSKDIAKGDVIGHESNVPTVVEEFEAQIFVLNHPSVITQGYTPVCHIHTAQIACQFVEIIKKVAPTQQDKPDFIKTGEAALVRLRPVQSVVVEEANVIPQMASFAIRDSGATVAVGKCTKILSKKPMQ